MILDAQLQDWLSRRIEAYCRDDAEPQYLKAYASRHSVLPLFVDWTGFWGISANGSVLLIDTEEDTPPVLEADARILRIALFQGARKFPELRPLVPRRPDAAGDCPNCHGQGVIDIPGVERGVIVCSCGGLGWLDQET